MCIYKLVKGIVKTFEPNSWDEFAIIDSILYGIGSFFK